MLLSLLHVLFMTAGGLSTQERQANHPPAQGRRPETAAIHGSKRFPTASANS